MPRHSGQSNRHLLAQRQMLEATRSSSIIASPVNDETPNGDADEAIEEAYMENVVQNASYLDVFNSFAETTERNALSKNTNSAYKM